MKIRKRRVCGYYRRGYTMSRRGRIAIVHDEYPIGYFTHLFKLREADAAPLLTYMGIHHTGMYGNATKFYRLPDKDDVNELCKIFDAFHSISAKEVKVINVMSHHLQKSISEKDIKILKSQKPRKRTRRKYGRRRRSRRKM